MRPPNTQCVQGPWLRRVTYKPGHEPAHITASYDEWVEPGQWRVARGQFYLTIGPTRVQDPLQHDRTIRWLILIDDRIESWYLSDVGSGWLVSPHPGDSAS